MTAKNISKNISALLTFLLSGISAGLAAAQYLFDTMPLMDDQSVPENPVAIVIIPFLALCMSAFITLVFAIAFFGTRKSVRFSSLLFRKSESRDCAAVRIIGYLIISRLIYESFKDLFTFGQFFISGAWYYASAVLFVLSGIIIFISIKNS